MPVHYALFDNHLTPDPNDMMAVVQPGDSADINEIADRMVAGGSTVGRPDIIAVLETLLPVTEALLLEGRRVQFGGLFEMFPRVRGVFTSATDSFDPARHKVDVAANPGAKIRAAVRQNATVVKDETILPAPNLVEFFDLGSGTANESLTPGNIGRITGNRLKYNPDAADEGIYLIDAMPTEYKVTNVLDNKPSRLTFLIPDIVGATFRLEVRARVGGSDQLRSGQLDATLATV